jgi:hypothetical protein
MLPVAALVALAAITVVPATAGADPAPSARPTTTLPTWPERPARIALIGDSVAGSAADALATEAARRGMVLETFTRAGCGITNGIPAGTNNPSFSARCVRDNDAFLDRAAADPVDAVVVMSSWEVNSHTVGGTPLGFRTPEWDAWMTGQLEGLQDRFDGAPLLLATIAPRAPLGPVSTMSPSEVDQVLRYNEFLRGYASWRTDEAAIVDVNGILCPADPVLCPEFFGTARPRPDMGAHFDAAGAAWFAPQTIDRVQTAWDGIGTVVTTPPGF